MTPVGFRLHLSPDVLSKLVTAVVDRFRRFVRISRTEHAGAFYEVDLRILASYDAKEPKAEDGINPTESVTVTREMVGELFDLLGIFPQSEKQKLPEWVVREVRFLRGQILAARSELVGKVGDLPELYGHINNVFRRITSSCEKIEQLLTAK